MIWKKKKSDKTLVFVFVPVDRDGDDFQERLRGCIAAFNDAQPEAPPTECVNKSQKEKMPFWTWFLPNPLPQPTDEKI